MNNSIPDFYKSSRNSLNVALNPYQGKAQKVLCVCSAGVLRSPTIARELSRIGYNTRAVGSLSNFALIPITESLVLWADEIIFVDKECYESLDTTIKEDIIDSGNSVIVLDIPDHFGYGEQELIDIFWQQYNEAVK